MIVMGIKSFYKKRKGIGLIEIIIASAVISIGLLAIISFLIFSRGVTFQVGNQTEAVSLAEEAIEAVRSIRDEAWNSVSTAGTYYPVISANKWTLSGRDPGPIHGLYTRVVTIDDVFRDGSDNIAGSGSPDSDTKKVTATISWSESGRNKQVVIETYISNFVGN